MDEEHYVFVGEYYIVLLHGQAKVETHLDKVRVKFMTPAEKKKFE